MNKKHSEHGRTISDSNIFSKFGPTSLLIATVAIVFFAEAAVMMLLRFLNTPAGLSTDIIDATLLSLVVAPSLYFTFLKPMRESFLKRQQSEEAQKRLKEIDRMRSDFISTTTHELRSPVATIMGYSELLQTDLEADQRDDAQEVILKKSETLARLIDDLDQVSQLGLDNDIQLKKEKLDLLKTVNHVCDVCRQTHPEAPIHVNLPEGSLHMTYDEIRISQVLENLLSNAVKYSSGIQDLIEVSLHNYQDKVSIIIKDKGVGMTKEETRNIYNMFYRAETKKAAVGGLGLGMAIVKNIIQSHNGTIEIISQRKVGTEVKVSLPKLAETCPPEHNFNGHTPETTDLICERRIALALF